MINQTLWHFTKPSEILPKPLGFSEFSSKSVRFCLKTRCSHVPFFQIFHEKLSALMHMIGQKNVNSVKTTPYYGPKESIGCTFFWFFMRKSHSVENSKTSILSKHCALMSFFFKFLMKNPLLWSPYMVKKHQICQNYTIFGEKDNRMPFFSDFSRKNNCSNL